MRSVDHGCGTAPTLLHLAGWRLLGLLVLLSSAAALCAPAETELRLPLTIPYALLGDLAWQPGEAEGPAEFDDGPCRRLRIESSRLNPHDGGLHLVSSIEAVFGLSLLGRCIELTNWRGIVDALLEPYIDAAWQLRFRLGATQLRDAQGDSAPLLNFVWDLSQRFISRRVEGFGFDLRAPREQITSLLSAMIEPDALTDLQAVLASLRIGTPRTDAHGVQVDAQLTLPDGLVDLLLPPWPTDAAAPAAADFARLQLERLDAFVVAVVKLLDSEVADPALRQQLAALLLDSRYRVVEILSATEPFERDPVRALFIEDWDQLRAILLATKAGAGGRTRLLRYAAFLNAGDTLLALDAALPQLGLWISADGLRAALRELAPNGPEPSLEYGYRVDLALREMFGLPPESPPLPPDTDVEDPDEVDGEPGAVDDAPESIDNSALRLPAWAWAWLLERLIPSAHAATTVPDRVTELQRALGRRIPRRDELPGYTALVASLLEEVGRSELATRDLPEAHVVVYRNLLPATALMESCWRQFKREDGKPTYVVSSAGAVGMMQINQRVWRGLYDVDRLKWEVAYNARAGAQILLRYLEGPGLDVVKRTGKPQHLARATYAAYNAGPRGAARFLSKDGGLKLGPVDRKLWSHYQGFAGGGVADLERCMVSTAAKGPPEF